MLFLADLAVFDGRYRDVFAMWIRDGDVTCGGLGTNIGMFNNCMSNGESTVLEVDGIGILTCDMLTGMLDGLLRLFVVVICWLMISGMGMNAGGLVSMK